MKTGMNQVGQIDAFSLAVIIRMITNPFVFSGFASYGISSIAYLFALSKLDLSFAYPMIALGYVAVVLFSWLVLHEPISVARLAGVLLICLGVWLVGR